MLFTTSKKYVLAYHKISDPVNFESQLIYLKQKFNVICYKDFIDNIDDDKISKDSLLLTFDDGDISNYTIAFPLLKKYELPAIFFVITDLLNSDKPFWWDEIEYYLDKSKSEKRISEVKKWPNQKRKRYLEELRQKSKFPPLKYTQLTISQLNEMHEGGITIANHSHTHPMFDRCTTLELDEELSNSISNLQTMGFNPEVFAYPNGNFSLLAEKSLKKHGIKSSFLFDHKINKDELNPLRISRLIVNDTTPMWKFKFILSGWHSRILPLTRYTGKLLRKLKG